VLKGLGFKVEKAGILYVNNEYRYDGQRLDLEALFAFRDLKEEVVEIQGEIGERLRDLKAMLVQATRPTIQPSRHCRKPYICEFFEHCRKGLPDHWVLELSGIRQDQLAELAMLGIVGIRDIPESFNLSMIQARIRECVITGSEYVGKDLGAILRQYEPPIHFLDFETFAPAIPRYAGTHPYQTLPFLWSNHILSEDGSLAHEAHICDADKDPREEIARTLLASVGDRGTICTYATLETQVISDLAEHLPQYGEPLQGLLSRCRDLHADIRRDYYHPEFDGSFSIKTVLPVLVPSMSYAGLSVQDGGQAGMEYVRMIEPETPSEERERIRRALLEYCGQDTLAMVRIREELLRRSDK
jgi:hypothetical protein